MHRFLLPTLCVLAMMATFTAPKVQALDDEHWHKAQASIDKGIEFLRKTQNEDGSWSPQVGPAITALAIKSMLDKPELTPDDPTIAKALKYILSMQKPDGGIYDKILPNYNTSICISALSRIRNNPEVATAIAKGQKFLKGLQWVDQEDPDGKKVDKNHPYYGGVGYGGSGRPDISNTQIMLQALHDSGVDCNDPAFQRAMVFINRLQGHESNDMFADKINQDGGFIYATSINKDAIGVPESKASPEMIEAGKQGLAVSGLRTYGSVTYAGFKSYLYANLPRRDPRVLAALEWIQNNYTVDHNPGMPDSMNLHGYYYFFVTFSRALDAYGYSTIKDAEGNDRDWANDLIDRVVALQKEDGSWTNTASRWMEDNPSLVTAYALIALTHASN